MTGEPEPTDTPASGGGGPRTPKVSFTDIRFAAGVLFAGAAVFAAVELGPVSVNPIVRDATGGGINAITNLIAGPDHTSRNQSPVVAAAGGSVTSSSGSASAPKASAAKPSSSGGQGVSSSKGTSGSSSGSGSSGTGGSSGSGSSPTSGASGSGPADGTSLGFSGATVTAAYPTTGSPSSSGDGAGTTTTTTMAPTTGAPAGGTDTTTTTSTTTTTTVPAPTARQMIVSVQGNVGSFVTDSTTAGPVSHVLNDLAAALAINLWPAGGGDGNTLLSSSGPVFDNLQKAENDLQSIKSPPANWPIRTDQYTLDSAARLIAYTAILRNSCLPLHADHLQTALNELANGDANVTQGNLPGAVGHYKNAWTNALAAQGTTCPA